MNGYCASNKKKLLNVTTKKSGSLSTSTTEINMQDHILRIERRNPDGYSVFRTGHSCSHPRVPRAHQAGFSRRSLAGVGLSESVRCHGPGLALLTNGGVQQQHMQVFKVCANRQWSYNIERLLYSNYDEEG
ncbi:hypothetical protein TNCV_2320661 [Trichonephila clavipes]|nr:hypothetical protein TNCV_2320661 [Trichonephila clavipes]